MRWITLTAVCCLAVLSGSHLPGEQVQWPDSYDVEWTSPSEDCRGSMPLGNGEVALNAWIEPDGSLLFYIARSDAWDEYGRLLKIGRVRVKLSPQPDITKNFRQRLRLRDATLVASWGESDNTMNLSLWVEAHNPVIHAELRTSQPTSASAMIELWRTEPTEIHHLEVSDILLDRDHPEGRRDRLIARPDTLLKDWPLGIGWYHHNQESIGPALTAKIQGLAGFPRPDPLLDRVFGAVIVADSAQRKSDTELVTPTANYHRFDVYVRTCHPAKPERWLKEIVATKQTIEAVPLDRRRQEHEAYWHRFSDRSYLIVESTTDSPLHQVVPVNQHEIRFGIDQSGGNLLKGQLGRVSIWNAPLGDDAIVELSRRSPDQDVNVAGAMYTGRPNPGDVLPNSANTDWTKGLSIEAWVKLEKLPIGGGRLVDKTTPGQNNGFLLDTYPGNSLRLIVGNRILQAKDRLPAGQWHHVVVCVEPQSSEIKLFLNGRVVARERAEHFDPAFLVTRGYCLQRFITACAGRGPFPIKFNGSLFNVAWPGKEGDADYRQWGPGYWWQNTRLPYYTMCPTGDFELMQPLFQMYGRDLVPLFEFRTRCYFGHDGMFIPECIYFWGDVFSDTYGWTPFEERGDDKLQKSRWHKWAWVSGLELAWLMLDYYEYTQDRAFLRDTLLPVTNKVLAFFEQYYKVGEDGKLVMHPAQALETWWDCTNPMPEIAGLHAVTNRLLALGEDKSSAEEREFWKRLQQKLPDLPIREVDGIRMLAPAAEFASKHNVENPELYAVFPFRLVSFDKENRDLGVEALHRRTDRGHIDWRQDDIFMAYLGLAEEAREYLVARASESNKDVRFPAFLLTPDWVPDQCHWSVLMIALHSMVMQCEGRKIFVLPAWPRDWNVRFKLHAPYQTVVSAEYTGSRLVHLDVMPPERVQDVVLIQESIARGNETPDGAANK